MAASDCSGWRFHPCLPLGENIRLSARNGQERINKSSFLRVILRPSEKIRQSAIVSAGFLAPWSSHRIAKFSIPA